MQHQLDDRSPLLRQTIQKARWKILPFLVFMYVLAFIDRSNVGFAKSMLQADTGLSNAAYAFGASVFFIGYALFEIPSNLIMYKVGARIWLSRIMVTWGIVAASMAFTAGPISFYVLRFFLGITEAGFFPGIILYLTLWFPRQTRASSMGVFYFGLPLSLVLGSPLSGILLDVVAPFGLKPWQFMFIVEGLMASVVGVITFFYLTDRPAQAGWLSDEERTVLIRTIQVEDDAKFAHGPASLRTTFSNPRMLMFCVIYFTVQMSVYGVVFYLPTRIAGLAGDRVGTAVGFMTAIPWIVAIVTTFVVTSLADKTVKHRHFAAAMLTMAAAGIAASVLTESLPLAILAFCFAASGFVSVQPLFWTLPTNYLSGAAAAGGIGLVNAVGNLGGFVAPNLKTYAESVSGNPHMGMFTLAIMALIGATMFLLIGEGNVKTSKPVVAPNATKAL